MGSKRSFVSANDRGAHSYACAPLSLAEGMGFEPMDAFTFAGFQDRFLKPLGHPSV